MIRRNCTLQAIMRAEAESMASENLKLVKQVRGLREDLQRESALRASLEDSQTALMRRLRDMESIIEAEREEVFFQNNFDHSSLNVFYVSKHIIH